MEPDRAGKDSVDSPDAQLVRVGDVDDLAAKGRMMVRVGGKQIALFHGEKGVFACNNRCPHEGYPLVEGKFNGGCVLTCNWHNWKFDLETGETLVGGDRVRRYPVHVADGAIWLDVSDPPAEERARAALDSLTAAFPRHEYDRMARELARLRAAGTEPMEGIAAAVAWTHDRLEFGTTHAYAAAPDWLAVGERFAGDDAQRLVPVLEAVGHMAWDTRGEPRSAFAGGTATFDADALVAAIGDEDEDRAVALVRGALDEDLGCAGLERSLSRAALAHYQDFGHALIYVVKTSELIARLGPASAEPLLLALVRSLVYATREDLIPEFRAYGDHLSSWDSTGGRRLTAEDFRTLSVKRALALATEGSAHPQALFGALLGAAAWQFLNFDLGLQERTEIPVSQNVGWLDFTHPITFANAVRRQCTAFPDLWPRGLLQMACFTGRNAGFMDTGQDTDAWAVADAEAFFDGAFRGLFDHGHPEYIVPAHLLKTLTAAEREIAAAPDAPWVGTLLAALNRFLQSPLKRKHATRTARQALEFVALEG